MDKECSHGLHPADHASLRWQSHTLTQRTGHAFRSMLARRLSNTAGWQQVQLAQEQQNELIRMRLPALTIDHDQQVLLIVRDRAHVRDD